MEHCNKHIACINPKPPKELTQIGELGSEACIGEMMETVGPRRLALDPARFGEIGGTRQQLLSLPKTSTELSSGGFAERRPRARVHLPAGDWCEGPASFAHGYPIPHLDAE